LGCPIHGWKYGVFGQCLDVPSDPEESGYCKKIKLKSYPCVERGGLVWAYMGPPKQQPPFPAFEWMPVPATHRYISRRWQECNYLQPMEGGMDSSTVSFLLGGDFLPSPLHRGTK